MNWSAYFRAAEEEMSSFLVDPANAEWRDTMYARISKSILIGISECSDGTIDEQAKMLNLLKEKCRAKAEHKA